MQFNHKKITSNIYIIELHNVQIKSSLQIFAIWERTGRTQLLV